MLLLSKVVANTVRHRVANFAKLEIHEIVDRVGFLAWLVIDPIPDTDRCAIG